MESNTGSRTKCLLAERAMAEDASAGMEVHASSTKLEPASEPSTLEIELKPSIRPAEVKSRPAYDASSGIEAPLPEPTAESRSKIAHRVEYFHTGSRSTVYQIEGLRHEALLPGHRNDNKNAIFEEVDVNLTTEKEGTWSKASLPPTYEKGCPYIKILSPQIISALHHVVEYYPDWIWESHEVVIQAPYAIVWHHEDALEGNREKFRPGASAHAKIGPACANESAFEEIGTLLDFVRSKNGEDVRRARERYAEGFWPSHMRWLFYKPGMEVYFDTARTGEWETYIIKNFTPVIMGGAMVGFLQALWKLSGDSESNTLYIKSTPSCVSCSGGELKISDAHLLPCDYAERDEEVRIMGRTGKEIRKFFEKRGEMYCRLMRKGCFEYDGFTKTDPIRPYSGQVMVDPQQWVADNPDRIETKKSSHDEHTQHAIPLYSICNCPRCEEVLGSEKKEAKFCHYYMFTQNAKAPQHFLCPGTAAAFLFKTREWATLDVMSFKAPSLGHDILRHLVIPPDTKSMITNLTKKYVRNLMAKCEEEEAKQERGGGRTPRGKCENSATSPKDHEEDVEIAKPWSADFVSDKGEGLIFLLHGKPGVGKTYTAECVAAHTERPLLSLTCADIGTDPETVEKRLQRWFKIAASWGAIMLIDEADIYMEHRQVQDLQRNNLVAGFLRALEYYQGILFLTTNRVGTFDEAFMSRIHIMIHYPPFTDQDREAVWGGFFRKLEDEQSESMTVLESTRDYVLTQEVQNLDWNGREIRNAFQIAVALAQTEEDRDRRGRIQIRRDHIKSTVRMSKDFKDYLNKLHRKDETQRAAHAGRRLDSFGGSGNSSGGGRHF